MFSINSWNLNPNKDWYVKFDNLTSYMLVRLFNTATDALNGTNLVATANVDFGDDEGVTLEMADSGSPTISLFNPAVPFHLVVSGASGDTGKTYHLYPFVDLPEINNSVYRSEDLILRRVTNEINLHTHVYKNKTVSLSTVIDGLDINDVLEIDSDFRGGTSNNLVDEITISGTSKSLVATVGCVEYLDFKR